MSHYRLMFGIWLINAVLSPGFAAATCFAPLSDLSRRSPADFKDLEVFKPSVPKAPEVVRYLPLAGGQGDVVNIDFYYVIFAKPQNQSLADRFLDIRKHFVDFTRGSTFDFDFRPYGSYEERLALSNANQKLWESPSPTGALMSFELDTQYPNPQTVIQGGLKLIQFVHPRGDVQVTCASDTDFIFSTVESEKGWTHPVAGNRGFGMKDMNDGTWMFYSKAVDRASDSVFNSKVFKGKGVFCYGHLFWLQFYSNMKDYFAKNGLVFRKFGSENHGTVYYPFRPDGAAPPQLPCE